MSSQIFGKAAVSPPVLELGGNKLGILAAASWKVANAFLALATSNGASPLTILEIAAGILAIRLHQRLAGGDRILLGDDGRHSKRNDGNCR